MSLLDDIEDLLINIQVKQSKYKYDLITERVFNQKTKEVWKKHTIIKYHKEDIEDSYTGEVKRRRIQDTKVSGVLTTLIQWLLEEIHELGVDSS